LQITDVYVIKRPWVDQFMVAMAEAYEVVVFTASLAKYADPLLDLLDEKHTIRWRLFRDSCCPYEGNYVKDLSRLGRELQDTIIIDNSPHSYIFQPENAVPIGTFVGDNNDQDLLDLIPFLLSIAECDDVRDILEKRYPRRLRMY
jgi:RNA polymerase II subunit A small phosphatase-like protein